MASLYDPSDKTFVFKLVHKQPDGVKLIEKHGFSWPESDEGQLDLSAILGDTKKSASVKLQNIKARTRHQNYRDENGELHGAIEKFYPENEVLAEKTFQEQNRPVNGENGQPWFQSFYANGKPKEIYYINAALSQIHRPMEANGPQNQPAIQLFYENGNKKQTVYQRVFNRGNGNYTHEVNGPDNTPGRVEYYENGQEMRVEYFAYDVNGNPAEFSKEIPTIVEYYETGKTKRQYYEGHNGPRGFSEILFDETGTVTQLSYYNDKNRLVMATGKKKLELLGVNSKTKQIAISREYLREKGGIVLLDAAGSIEKPKTLSTSTQKKLTL